MIAIGITELQRRIVIFVWMEKAWFAPGVVWNAVPLRRLIGSQDVLLPGTHPGLVVYLLFLYRFYTTYILGTNWLRPLNRFKGTLNLHEKWATFLLKPRRNKCIEGCSHRACLELLNM